MSWWKSLAKVGLGLGGTALLGPLGGMAAGALGNVLMKDRAPGAQAAPGASPLGASPLAGADPLRAQLTADATANPFDSSTYRAGVADLSRRSGDAARVDAGAAASRGLVGGEFEIAQAANRARTALDGQSALAGQAMQARQGGQGALLALLNSQEGARQAEMQRRTQGRAATAGALGGVASAALPAILDLFNKPLRPGAGFGQG